MSSARTRHDLSHEGAHELVDLFWHFRAYRAKPVGSAQVDDDRFHLRVFRDPLVATLASEAGFLEAAERDLVRVAGGVVGADQAVLELPGHPNEPRHVARVEAGRQPARAGVGATGTSCPGLP